MSQDRESVDPWRLKFMLWHRSLASTITEKKQFRTIEIALGKAIQRQEGITVLAAVKSTYDGGSLKQQEHKFLKSCAAWREDYLYVNYFETMAYPVSW